MIAQRINPFMQFGNYNMPERPLMADNVQDMGGGLFGGMGGGIPAQAPTGMQNNLAALQAAQGFGGGNAPNFMSSAMLGAMQAGGVPNFMNPALIGAMFKPQQQAGGYDSSGINPNGMYFPRNPGGFLPNLGFGGR